MGAIYLLSGAFAAIGGVAMLIDADSGFGPLFFIPLGIAVGAAIAEYNQ